MRQRRTTASTSHDLRTALHKAVEALIAQWRLDTQDMRSNAKRYPEGRILAIEQCTDELCHVLAKVNAGL
jgi:hypothetical protein